MSGFAEDFPGVRAILGTAAFDTLSKAYLKACPSTSFTLRNIGSRLDPWLPHTPELGGPRQHLVVDMARLEWADINAFDGKASTPQTPQTWLKSILAAFVCACSPTFTYSISTIPVDDLLLAVRKDAEDLRRPATP